jgi:hypothetical protein
MNQKGSNMIWGKVIEIEMLRNKSNGGLAGSFIPQGTTMWHEGWLVRICHHDMVPFKKGYFYIEAQKMRSVPFYALSFWFFLRRLWNTLKTKLK